MKGFKTHLEELIIKRTKETGERVTQRQIQAATGISQPTISRWYQGTIDRLDYDTVRKLMAYFKCEFAELVSIDAQASESVA